MNASVLAGLGGLLSGIGGQMTRNYERRQEEDAAERKARLAMQLEEQLWQRKMDYAKANPTYAKYITDPLTGDVTGFDEFGRSKLLYTADPALEQHNRNMLEAELQAKQAPYLNAQTNQASHEALDPLRAQQLRASIKAYERDKSSGGMSPGQSLSLESQATTIAQKLYPQYFPVKNEYTGQYEGGDEEAARAAISSILERAGAPGLAAPTMPQAANPFENLVPNDNLSPYPYYE